MLNIIINIARHFSKFPGGRYVTDSNFSGQRFREEILLPALKNYDTVTLQIDGTLGYGTSWLEEAFSNVSVISNPYDIAKILKIETENEVLRYTIASCICKGASELNQSRLVSEFQKNWEV